MLTSRLLIVCGMLILLSTYIQGQSDSIGLISPVNSPWLAPVITDEMTKDPEQNRQWRLGQYKYSAQPKHMWEVGVHGGHFFIDGDVDPTIPGGYGTGLHLRKALTYFTSIRFDGFYGNATGLEPQPWRHRSYGGGLVESNGQFQGWEGYSNANPANDSWFPSYRTTYYYGAVQLVFNVGNLMFHKERNKWNTYVAFGVGLDHNATKLDLLDEAGNPYAALRERTGFTRELFNTKAGRDEIKNALEAIYDGNYETSAFQKEGVFRLGDDINLHPIFTASVGVSRKISRRLNIGVEHQLMASDNDYLDGIKFRTALDQSNNVDMAHYTSLRLGFNVGNFNKKIEPLYWVNPMDGLYNDIAEVKARPQFEWIDEDNDGVLDLIDLEPNTPDGCLVDTRGVTLDSDGDGVVDCKDREPFSPPGYPVNEFGVAQIENDKPIILTEADVINIIQNNCELCANTGYGVQSSGGIRNPETGSTIAPGGLNIAGGTTTNSTTTTSTTVVGPDGTPVTTSVVSGTPGTTTGIPGRGNTATVNNNTGGAYNSYGTIINSGCGNWFLPMLHYDLDKYGIRPEGYAKLHQIAYVMKNCPDICITAHGHTDVRSSNAYNRVLSYKRAKEAVDYLVSNYGIDRSRFNVMYGGEESPLINFLKDNHYTSEEEEFMQFMNRRVEFRVCEATDADLERPDGPDAGKPSYGPSRPGSKYKFNPVKTPKNSGY